MSGYPRIRTKAAANIHELDLLEKKIILATDGIMTKFSESTLRDKLSKGNALVAPTVIGCIVCCLEQRKKASVSVLDVYDDDQATGGLAATAEI